MKQRYSVKVAADYDDERQRAYLWTAILIWILIALFLVLRDPIWRLLYEGDLASPIRITSVGWTELDKKLVKRLTSVEVKTVSGLGGLEEAIVVSLDRRRAAETVEGEESPSPLEVSDELRALARSRARTRLALAASAEVTAPELLYPETYLAFVESDRLISSIEIHQRLPASVPLERLGFADELAGGWLNRSRFRGFVTKGVDVRIGVGAVSSNSGETVVDVVLEETFVLLDSGLAPVISEDAGLELAGSKLSDEDVTLYFKGPSDPGFYPVDVQWTGLSFVLERDWSQGSGNYALRAGRGERLSDPRPILVD